MLLFNYIMKHNLFMYFFNFKNNTLKIYFMLILI